MPTTLETAVAKYLRSGNPAQRPREEYCTTLRKWARWGGGVPLDQLGRKEIREFLDWVYEDAAAQRGRNPGRTANKVRSRAGVLFIVVHVVGSGNNYRADHTPSMREFNSRNTANLAFLKESFTQAIEKDVPGVAVVIHANPGFEQGGSEGFKDFLAAMREFLAKYRKPVVCIHGDSHYFRIDKPFKDASGRTFLHFTRMEVFGSPNVAGVVVSVDPNDPEVFSYRPYYIRDK